MSLRWPTRAALLLLLPLLAAPAPASAAVDGPCQVYVEGRDLAAEEHPTIAAPADGNLTFRIVAAVPILHWSVTLHYGPFERDAIDQDLPPGRTDHTGNASVGEYTQYGTGLYEVTGKARMADGTTCTATMRLQVSGSPFTSVLGIAAVAILGAAGVGILLTVLQIVLDAKDVVEAAKDFIEQAKHGETGPSAR